MTIQEHISNFIELGKFLGQFKLENSEKLNDVLANDGHFEDMQQKIDSAVHHNGWFTRDNIIFSINQWNKALTRENLEKWTGKYSFNKTSQKTVGIVMAGNIPLVGFHDFISVLLAGHKVLVKQSSNDKLLLPVIASYLTEVDKRYQEKIKFTNDKLEYFDAVIATGSDNTSRYFEYYFKGKPSLIRKNRNSAAIITGEETQAELAKLGEDIFRYYGLGCRNVSKIFVPKAYDFDSFFKAMYDWNPIINQNKYANNYDYNKAVYLMSEFKLLENGFLILKEDTNYSSPISTLFYEYYDDEEDLKKKLSENSEKLQCIVTSNPENAEVAFGQTQHPKLWDYADNVDTLEFLLNIED